MERLWSPWRAQYISTFGTSAEYKGCIFCDAYTATDDDAVYLVQRHEHCFTIMNLYPYNSGHLLIVPHTHTDTIVNLAQKEYYEMMDVVRIWLRVFKESMNPQGFNIGTNIGRSGGAGIDTHVHMHIVPRWQGDSNFMPVIGETKVLSEDLRETMQRLRTSYNRIIQSEKI